MSTQMGTLIVGNYPYDLLKEESIGSYLAPGTLDLCSQIFSNIQYHLANIAYREG